MFGIREIRFASTFKFIEFFLKVVKKEKKIENLFIRDLWFGVKLSTMCFLFLYWVNPYGALFQF